MMPMAGLFLFKPWIFAMGITITFYSDD